MLEVMLVSLCAGMIFSGLFALADAASGPWDLRSDEARAFDRERKWAVNPRVMRWLTPIIVVGIVAYYWYLKYLGLV